jgi:hypothetical protein
MKNLIIISVFLFTHLIANAQSENDTIDLANINVELIENMFYEKLNSFRKEKGMPTYIIDPISIMTAEYNNLHYLTYNVLRDGHLHLNAEPVNGLILNTQQDRLNYFSGILRYSERDKVVEYSDCWSECSMNGTYKEYVDDFCAWIQKDMDSEIGYGAGGKYIGVKFSFKSNIDLYSNGHLFPDIVTTVTLSKDAYNAN